MSLALSAIRNACVFALLGRTRAGANVFDSEIGPIEQRALTQPAIIVYTDDLTADAGAPLLANRGDLTLTIALIVTARGQSEDGDDDIVIPLTDSGIELTVDHLTRQVQIALADPDNAWAEALRGLALSMSVSASMRGSNHRDGLRLAGRELRLSVRPIADPLPGADLSAPWLDVLKLALESESADANAWGAAMTSMLAEPDGEPEAIRAAALGLTAADLSALGGDAVDVDALTVEPATQTGA